MRFVVLAFLLWPLAVHAGVQVQVKGVEGSLQQAVRSGVQISQYGDRDVTDAQVRRLFSHAKDQAATALKPYGYFDARVTGSLEQTDGGWVATLDVDRGEPVRVHEVDIRIAGDAGQLDAVQQAVKAFKPAEGDILDQGLYTSSRNAISGALAAVGYIDADMAVHKVAVHRSTHQADIHLLWKPGQRYQFGKVIFEGSQLEDGFLQRYVPFEHGDWYTQDKLLALQRALTGADYFSVVNVLPQVKDAENGFINVKVELVPDKRSVYTGGPFIGSDVGLGVRVGLRRRWVNRQGHKWKNELILAQRLKSLSSWYTIPMPGPHQRAFNLGGKYRDIDTATSKSKTLELVGNETREWHGWLRTLGLHVLSGTFTVGRRGDEPRDAPGVEHGNSSMLFAEASLMKKRADNPGFVHHGWLLSLSSRSTLGEALTDTRYTDVKVDAKWIYAFNPRNRMILRGTAAMSSSGDFSQLPPQLRFFAGGARSIRGFGFKALGPRNAHDRVIGGHNLLVASTTAEHYFTKTWGVAAFVDAGNAFDGSDIRPRVGAGLGLRWNSPVGMIRVDVGVPVAGARNHAVHLHLVIGPDL